MIIKSIEPFDNCPKCGSDDVNLKWIIKDYLYNIPYKSVITCCKRCGFEFQNQITYKIDDMYKDYQLHDNLPDKPKKHSKIITYLKTLKDKYYSNNIGLVPEYINNGKILEIGCGNGNNLIELKRLGWKNIYAIEPRKNKLLTQKENMFNITYGKAEEILKQYPDNYFDVIVMQMVIEHIKNPFDLIKIVSSKLKPGGEFLFSTAQRDSIDAWIYKGYWVGYELRHMVFFRKQDIKDMLKDDFEDVKLYHQIGAVDFIRSSSWRLKDGRGNIFDKLIIAIGMRILNLILIPLSMMGMTTRVSIRCKKK